MPQAMPVAFNKAFVITTSDTVDLPQWKQLSFGLTEAVFVGVTGNVVAVWEDNTTSTFVGVPAGAILPIAVRRINATSTTATTLLALFQV